MSIKLKSEKLSTIPLSSNVATISSEADIVSADELNEVKKYVFKAHGLDSTLGTSYIPDQRDSDYDRNLYDLDNYTKPGMYFVQDENRANDEDYLKANRPTRQAGLLFITNHNGEIIHQYYYGMGLYTGDDGDTTVNLLDLSDPPSIYVRRWFGFNGHNKWSTWHDVHSSSVQCKIDNKRFFNDTLTWDSFDNNDTWNAKIIQEPECNASISFNGSVIVNKYPADNPWFSQLDESPSQSDFYRRDRHYGFKTINVWPYKNMTAPSEFSIAIYVDISEVQNNAVIVACGNEQTNNLYLALVKKDETTVAVWKQGTSGSEEIISISDDHLKSGFHLLTFGKNRNKAFLGVDCNLTNSNTNYQEVELSEEYDVAIGFQIGAIFYDKIGGVSTWERGDNLFVDELRCYSRVLTKDECIELYKNIAINGMSKNDKYCEIIIPETHLSNDIVIPDRINIKDSYYKVLNIGSELSLNREENKNIVSISGAKYAITLNNGIFKNCNKLNLVNLSSLTNIDDNTFINCSNIEHLNIPNVVTIGHNVFEGCINLKSIFIGKKTEDQTLHFPWGLPEEITTLTIKTERDYYDDWKVWADSVTTNNRKIIIDAPASMIDIENLKKLIQAN